LRETGALDGLFEQIDSGEARDDRGPGGCSPLCPEEVPGARPAGRVDRAPGLWEGRADDIGPRQAPLGGTTTKTIDSPGGPLRDQWCPGVRAGSL